MFLRISLAALLASVALMLWGYVFWIGLAIPRAVLRPLPGGQTFAAQLKAKMPGAGVYAWPAPPSEEVVKDPKAVAAYADQYRRGPVVHLFYQPAGTDPMSVTTYARGMLQYFAAAWLAGWLLGLIGARAGSYARRVGFVTLLGLFAAVFIDLGPPIWFQHPWDYHLVLVLYDVLSALAMGLVLAAIVRPSRDAYWSLDGK